FGWGIVAREIGADDLPRLAVVGARKHDLRRDEQLVRVGRREEDRVRPSEAVGCLGRCGAGHIAWPGADVLQVARLAVEAPERAIIAASIRYVRAAGLGCDER